MGCLGKVYAVRIYLRTNNITNILGLFLPSSLDLCYCESYIGSKLSINELKVKIKLRI